MIKKNPVFEKRCPSFLVAEPIYVLSLAGHYEIEVNNRTIVSLLREETWLPQVL